MKKFIERSFTAFGISFLLSFIIYHIIISSYFPVNEANELIAPDWYFPVGGIVGSVVGIAATVATNLIYKIFGKRVMLRYNYRMFSASQIMHQVDCMAGHDFEYWCADLLSRMGFYNVVVTQGSGDQGIDVLATRDGLTYAIQCKCYTSNLGNTPVQEAYTGKTIYKCQVAAVMTNVHFTVGGKQAAEATGVLLWDRDFLFNAISTYFPHTSNAATQNPLFFPVADFVIKRCIVSPTVISKIFKISKAESVQILYDMEQAGMIGPNYKNAPREVYIDPREWPSIKLQMLS